MSVAAPPKTEPVAIAVVLHGLNNCPEIMDDLAHSLSDSGIKTHRIALPGHYESDLTIRYENYSNSSHTLWRETLITALRTAQKEAQEAKVPLYFIGFSLGGALFIDLLSEPLFSERLVDKAVLLSPAVTPKFKRTLSLVGFSKRLRKLSFPSQIPKPYRANDRTVISVYRELFQVSQNALSQDPKTLDQMKTLVLIDPKDELVDYKKLKKWVTSKSLSHWTLQTLNQDQPDTPAHAFRHHMIFNREVLGETNWNEMLSRIKHHFGLK